MGVLLFGMRLRVVAMVKGSLGILGFFFEGVLIHIGEERCLWVRSPLNSES